jgi:protein TonB
MKYILLALIFLSINTSLFAQEKTPEEAKQPLLETPETMPEFPGGLEQLYLYIGKNLRYPGVSGNERIEGKVYVSFLVKKDGSISEVEVLKGMGKGFDTEAVRLVKSFPKWKPGKMYGKPVDMKMTLPVVFRLSK